VKYNLTISASLFVVLLICCYCCCSICFCCRSEWKRKDERKGW